MPSQNITIKEIATLAGVSQGTVDRVMHNRADVSEATRNKVLAIIEQFKYQPNLIARSLASKKKIVIALLFPTPSLTHPFWHLPVEGIKKAIGEVGHYGVETVYYNYDFLDVEEFNKQAAKLLNDRPDALILAPFFNNESTLLAKECDALNIPYVYIDSKLEQTNYLSFVGQDTFQSGYLAAKMLNYYVDKNSSLLIVNLAHQSDHINTLYQRAQGFKLYFSSNPRRKNVNLIDVSLNESDYPDHQTLQNALQTKGLKAIYVPSSRAYIVAEQLEKLNIHDVMLIGHDLILKNTNYLEKDIISFLINQRPVEQGYKAIITIFNHLILNRFPDKNDFIPLDIVTKENYACYL